MRTSVGAAMKTMISDWMMAMRSMLTPAETCICRPPASSAPNSSPASSTPIGCPRPSSATAMASKPMPAEKFGEARPSTPSTWLAPARPASAPAIAITATMRKPERMPA